MFKVSVKRYGYPVWNGHQQIPELIRLALPSMSEEERVKFSKDNRDFISTIKTLVSTSYIKSTVAEAKAGLSWTTEFTVGNEVEANAVKEFFGIRVQERVNSIEPNGGLVIQATVTRI